MDAYENRKFKDLSVIVKPLSICGVCGCLSPHSNFHSTAYARSEFARTLVRSRTRGAVNIISSTSWPSTSVMSTNLYLGDTKILRGEWKSSKIIAVRFRPDSGFVISKSLSVTYFSLRVNATSKHLPSSYILILMY